MPKTKLESVVFSAMMVFCMVFSMTCYTGALRAGGVTYGLFAQSIREMWIEFAFVFLLVFFGVSRIAPRIALKLLHPRELPQILFTLVVQGLTVSMVVPAVTLFASLLHGGVNPGFFPRWIQLAGQCFPAALILQVFYIGPLVRPRKDALPQMPRYPPEARSKLRTRGRTQHLRTGRFAHH